MEESGVAVEHAEIHQGERDEGGNEEVDTFAVQDAADDEGEGDLNEAGEDGGGVGLEDGSDDEAKDGEDDGECEKENGEEENACATGKDPPCDVAYGLAFVAKRDHECSKIMHCPDEDRAKEDPKEGWNPAPDDGECGADDRAGSGNGGEVMTEDDGFAGGDVVVAVFELDGGRGAVGVEFENFLRKPLSVGMVSDEVGEKRAESDEECGHVVELL